MDWGAYFPASIRVPATMPPPTIMRNARRPPEDEDVGDQSRQVFTASRFPIVRSDFGGIANPRQKTLGLVGGGRVRDDCHQRSGAFGHHGVQLVEGVKLVSGYLWRGVAEEQEFVLAVWCGVSPVVSLCSEMKKRPPTVECSVRPGQVRPAQVRDEPNEALFDRSGNTPAGAAAPSFEPAAGRPASARRARRSARLHAFQARSSRNGSAFGRGSECRPGHRVVQRLPRGGATNKRQRLPSGPGSATQ